MMHASFLLNHEILLLIMNMHRLDIVRMMWTVGGHCNLLTSVRNLMAPSAKVPVIIVLSLQLQLKRMCLEQPNNLYVTVSLRLCSHGQNIRC